MATKSLDVVTLSAPIESISKTVNETFTISQSYTLTGNGGSPTVNIYWQYDQGSSTWIDIPTSGSTGLTADSGAQNSAIAGTTYNRTITCKSVGVYVIRAKAVDTTNTITKYSTNTPTVTVAGEPQLYYQDVSGDIAFARQTKKMIRKRVKRKKK